MTWVTTMSAATMTRTETPLMTPTTVAFFRSNGLAGPPDAPGDRPSYADCAGADAAPE
ncbi:hypothetical protein IOD13_16315 [Brevibacterium casei]|nr:hypothetical protein [Brevibacterium casei]